MKNKLKWATGIAAVIIVLLIVGSIFAGNIIENKLKNSLQVQSHGVYKLYFQDFGVNIFTGSVEAAEVFLTCDSTRFHTLSADKLPGTALFEFSAASIEIDYINIFALLFRDKLTMNTLSFERPSVTMISHPEIKISGDTASADGSLYAMISPALKALEIDNIEIKEGTFSRKIHRDKEEVSLEVTDISLVVTDFRIDASAGRGKRLFYSDGIDLTLKNTALTLPDSLYALKIREMGISLADQKIYADSIQFLPRYGKYEFGRVKGEEIDRVDLTTRHVEFSQVNFEAFLEEQQLKAGYLVIDGMEIHAFRDKRLPFPENNKPALPQEMLHNLEVYLKIDSINLRNSSVTYEEKIAETEKAGRIRFENLNALIYNVTNDKELTDQGLVMKTYASAQLMGEGTLRATIEMPLASRNNAHTFKGTLSPMSLKAINPMLKYQAFAEIESGYNNALTFSATANDDFAQGSMHFAYRDLKINLLKKNGNGKKGVLSFVANLFISRDNPSEDTADQVAALYYERDKRKFIFNFWWKTLLSGFKSVLKGDNKKDKSQEESKGLPE